MIGLPPKIAGFDVIRRRRRSVSLQVLATTHLLVMLPQFRLSVMSVPVTRRTGDDDTGGQRHRVAIRSLKLHIEGLTVLMDVNDRSVIPCVQARIGKVVREHDAIKFLGEDPVRRLAARVELPVAGRVLVRGVQDRLLEERSRGSPWPVEV